MHRQCLRFDFILQYRFVRLIYNRKITLNAYGVLGNDFDFGIYEILGIKCTLVRKLHRFTCVTITLPLR